MNALAEPLELLEAECNAHGWRLDDREDDGEDSPFDEACSQRVLAWMVQRICTMPALPAA